MYSQAMTAACHHDLVPSPPLSPAAVYSVYLAELPLHSRRSYLALSVGAPGMQLQLASFIATRYTAPTT
eukprot:COSAG02_NODE_4845_length_4912_cov_11.302514_6_plen_69_part_00